MLLSSTSMRSVSVFDTSTTLCSEHMNRNKPVCVGGCFLSARTRLNSRWTATDSDSVHRDVPCVWMSFRGDCLHDSLCRDRARQKGFAPASHCVHSEWASALLPSARRPSAPSRRILKARGLVEEEEEEERKQRKSRKNTFYSYSQISQITNRIVEEETRGWRLRAG